MNKCKSIAKWLGIKVVQLAVVAIMALAVVEIYFQEQIAPRLYDTVRYNELCKFARRDPWAADDTTKLPAKLIDWENRKTTYNEILVPAQAIDWQKDRGPLVPVQAVKWDSDYVTTAGEVRIVDLDGPEEILVFRRGTQFHAYKIKDNGTQFATARRD